MFQYLVLFIILFGFTGCTTMDKLVCYLCAGYCVEVPCAPGIGGS